MAEIKDSIITAIENIVKKRINQIQADRTIKVIINRTLDSTKNKYEATYQGGFIPVYARKGELYAAGDIVYVLVPEGNFSNQKMILMEEIK